MSAPGGGAPRRGVEDVPWYSLRDRISGTIIPEAGPDGQPFLISRGIQPVYVVADRTRGTTAAETVHTDFYTQTISWRLAASKGAPTFELWYEDTSTGAGFFNFLSQTLGQVYEAVVGANLVEFARGLFNAQERPASYLLIVDDLVLTLISGPGPFGFAFFSENVGPAPAFITEQATQNPTSGASSGSILGKPARSRIFAGRQPHPPPQGNPIGQTGSVDVDGRTYFTSPGGPMGDPISGTNRQIYRPFERVQPFLLPPGRMLAGGLDPGFAGFTAGGPVTQAILTIVWREVAMGV